MWSTQSSFCFVTFSEHTAAVTGLAFTQSGRAILSSSLDGNISEVITCLFVAPD